MRARHSFIPILVMAAAACHAPPARTTPSTSTTSSTSSTTTSTLPPTTTAPPTTTTAAAPVARTSPPPPAPTPVVTACPAPIVDLINKYWDRFGPSTVEWAISIAWRESNCRPDVVSPTGCYGIFQMALPLHADLFAGVGYPDWRSVRFDAEANIAAAAALYASSGSSPWRL